MKKLLLALLLPFTISFVAVSQVTYEDFEGGSMLTWEGINGGFDGIVANPDTNFVNNSANCGSFTKAPDQEWSFAITTLPAAMDLSTNNQFSIKVYSTVPTQFLFKLEGSGGAVEAWQNIANTNVWQEYHFDFSSQAANMGLEKIVIFFNPPNQDEGNTYLFDEITAHAAGACAGTVADATILDDFECQRNTTYGAGWDIIRAADNPDPSGINVSATVGMYEDPLDEWSALVLDYNAPLDLSVNNQVTAKIWAPKTGQALFKLEGGTSGPAEIWVDITEINTWVEYSVDFSSQAEENHKKIAIFFNAGVTAEAGDVYYIDDISRTEMPPPPPIEDFEDGGKLSWEGINGVYDGIVANPDTNFINNSPDVGSFTKAPDQEWCFAIAELAEPLDMTTNNQFSIKVYSPVSTHFLFKLEGPLGAIESWQKIANANVWQEYHFDFSSMAANDSLTKIVIFFNPPNQDEGDTYLFDDIVAYPAGDCAGTVVDNRIIDDFECQRNATYGGGWDILNAVDNPNPGGVNTSSKVGQYVDPIDEWSALVIDHIDPLDLSVDNQIKAKVWSPKTGRILFKLEGGVSAPAERWVDVMETNSWVEYTADFSDQASANHKKIAIFFNGGVLAEEGDIYYIDDIGFGDAPPPAAIEDFEDGPRLPWEPLNGDMANHGTFNGVVANPDMAGINESPNIGSYTKGSAAFSTLSSFLPAGLDLSTMPQLNLQVWAPVGSAEVTMQLVSPTQGNKDVSRAIETTDDWVQLGFNFEEFDGITDFERVNILFDGGTAGAGTTYFYDNLVQSGSTVDPCEGVEPIFNIYDDYECQRNVMYVPGDDRLKVVDNPDVTDDNPSTTVGEYTDPQDEWSALGFDTGEPLELDVLNQFHIKIWSPMTVPLLFKLEGGSSAAKEVWTDVTEANKWVEYVIDFSDQAEEDHGKIVVFFNGGQLPSQEDVYYVDDVLWTRAAYTGCVDDHETALSSITNFTYFANGHLEAEGKPFQIVDNPLTTGINDSEKVGEFVKASDSEPWAGMYADLDAPIDFGDNKTAKVKVLMDHIGNFTIKLEASATGADNVEIPVENTLTNEWEELVWDMSSVPDDAQFMRLTVFFDLLIDPTGEDVTSYFDDIVFGDGNCNGSVSVFNPVKLERIEIKPNPVADRLTINNTIGIEHVDILSMYGQKIHSVRLGGHESMELNMEDLLPGTYLLAGFDRNGQLIANAKFIKQ